MCTVLRLTRKANHVIRVTFLLYPIDVLPYCDLQPKFGSETCWVWQAPDHAEGQFACQIFALKFRSSAAAAEFRSKYDAAEVCNLRLTPELQLISRTHIQSLGPLE